MCDGESESETTVFAYGRKWHCKRVPVYPTSSKWRVDASADTEIVRFKCGDAFEHMIRCNVQFGFNPCKFAIAADDDLSVTAYCREFSVESYPDGVIYGDIDSPRKHYYLARLNYFTGPLPREVSPEQWGVVIPAPHVPPAPLGPAALAPLGPASPGPGVQRLQVDNSEGGGRGRVRAPYNTRAAARRRREESGQV
jgi:hypothetical protein